MKLICTTTPMDFDVSGYTVAQLERQIAALVAHGQSAVLYCPTRNRGLVIEPGRPWRGQLHRMLHEGEPINWRAWAVLLGLLLVWGLLS